MIYVKYFLEEPASFEGAEATDPGPSTTPLDPAEAIARLFAGPVLHRGYLSVSDAETGTSGATATPDRAVWIEPTIRAIGDDSWWTCECDEELVDPARALGEARHDLVVVGPARPPADLFEAGMLAGNGPDGRSVLRRLTDHGIVLRTEPSFDGVDWSFLSRTPLADRFRAAFADARVPGVRRFVIPLRQARGEHRFHFERYDPDLFRSFEVS